MKSTHFCPATSKFTTKEYRDLTSLGGVATGSVCVSACNGQPLRCGSLSVRRASQAYPTKDADGNLLETEYGLCEYMDHQYA